MQKPKLAKNTRRPPANVKETQEAAVTGAVSRVPKQIKFEDEEVKYTEESADEDPGNLAVLDALKHVCPICGKEIPNEPKFKKHVRAHRKPHRCEICSKTFFQPGQLKAHILTHDETFCLECTDCGLQFKTKPSLQNHHIRQHSDREYRYTCDKCSKQFRLKCDLNGHIRNSHTHIMHVCRICGKSVRDFRYHEWKHQKDESSYKFSCSICAQKFKFQTKLSNHMMIHKNGLECSECGKKFTRPKLLAAHKAKHKNPVSGCPICGKLFKSGTLNEHILTHARQRPYECNLCGLGFTQRSSMMRHWRSHPGSHTPPPKISIAALAKNIIELHAQKE